MLYNKKIHDRAFENKGHPIKNTKQYWKDINYLVENGYDKSATCDLDKWFMSIMKDILPQYKVRENFAIINAEKTEEENYALWQETIDKMIDLLEKMDEASEVYNGINYKEKDKTVNKSKNEFFKLFSKYFYEFWD